MLTLQSPASQPALFSELNVLCEYLSVDYTNALILWFLIEAW